MHDDEAARCAARKDWPVTVHRLGDEPPIDATTPEQRLAMMWELAVQAWAVAGIPIPDYERKDMPVRVLRFWEDDGS